MEWDSSKNNAQDRLGGTLTPYKPLPALTRAALHRIAQAEVDARANYDRDKQPYLPAIPTFSFLETSVNRAMASILQYLRVYAEEVLDANLTEYVAAAPSEILTNMTLLLSLEKKVFDLTGELWAGYKCALFIEPSRRRAHHTIAFTERTLTNRPELEPHRYPDAETWAGDWKRMAPEIKRLEAQREASMHKTIGDIVRRYQGQAAAQLNIELVPPGELRPEPSRSRENSDAEPEVREPTVGTTSGAKAPSHKKSPRRRNRRSVVIDDALIQAAESKPISQKEVFQILEDRKVPTPVADPFHLTGGWFTGFKDDPTRARAWLSKKWKELNLPPFSRGPKPPKRRLQ